MPTPDRPRKPNEVRAAASTRVARLPREEGVRCSLEKGPIASNAPLEEQIANTTKFLERAKKRLVAADVELQSAVKKKAQCEEEVAEAEADLARMREAVPLPSEKI